MPLIDLPPQPAAQVQIIPIQEFPIDELSSKKKIVWVVTRQRNGETREYKIAQGTGTGTTTPPQGENVLEIIADEQEYDQEQEIITAKGNVEIRFDKGVLNADIVRVNMKEKLAVAEGKVVLKRGEQILRGERFEYYFVQDKGVVYNANGEIYQPGFNRDLGPSIARDASGNTIPDQSLSQRLSASQPLQRVSTSQGYTFVFGSVRDFALVDNQINTLPTRESGGQINRLRFQAERIDFDSEGWQAANMRLTNDPFSPPELEIRADTANFKNVAPLVDELTTTNSRVVLDQQVSVPLFQDRLVFDRRARQPGLFNIGFDGEDRGGLYLERSFSVIDTNQVTWDVTPQYLIQRAFFPDSFTSSDDKNSDTDDDANIFRPAAFGVKTNFNVAIADRTSFSAVGALTTLDPANFGDKLRANIQLKRDFGDLYYPYSLRLEYNYRERLFNGSLGFQTVQSSVGAIFTSAPIALGNTEIYLFYQGSIQNINADTDRQELLSSDRDDDLTNLTRYQGAAFLYKAFRLWQGEPLPATAEEGMRYTPIPVLPYVELVTGISAVGSFYSNGDTQPSLTGTIGVQGQLGHFSGSFLDYTGFNVSFSQGLRGDQSPFKFDRFYDAKTFSLGVTQQLYGPLRLGVQTSLNLDTNEEISTDYILEYSRRTHNIILRYNPTLQIGSIGFRINDFNWVGDPEPFAGSGIKPVIQGVTD